MKRLDATQLGGTTCEHARELVSCLLVSLRHLHVAATMTANSLPSKAAKLPAPRQK